MKKSFFSKIREKLNNYPNILFVVLAIIAIILLFINYKYDRPNFLLNMSNNLFSEIVGIVVTVFFIEKLISKYEKRKRTKIELKAKISILNFVAYSLEILLGIYGLREKLKIEDRIVEGERIDLGARLKLELAPELLNDNPRDPENIYINKFKSGLPISKNFSGLDECVKQSEFILNMFSEDIDADVIDLLHACRAELATISRVHPSLLINLELEADNPRRRNPLRTDATINTYAYIFSDSFSRAVIRLNELYNLIKI